MTAPRITRVETLYSGWARYLKAHVVTADGQDLAREVEDHGDAACVLPYDPERRVALLVRQMRAPMLLAAGVQDVLEAPAGRLDGDEPEACARREAEEETGLRLREVEALGLSYPMPGISTERIHFFLAPYAEGDRIGAGLREDVGDFARDLLRRSSGNRFLHSFPALKPYGTVSCPGRSAA